VPPRTRRGAADALAINPDLIHVSISGYGSGGPYEQKKAYDLLVQCETGLLSVTGTPDAPAKSGISIADIATGMYAYTGILTALLQRAATGRGDVLEISMLEALGEWMGQPYFYAEYGGTQQPRSGAEHATVAPYGPFDTADGTVFFGTRTNASGRSSRTRPHARRGVDPDSMEPIASTPTGLHADRRGFRRDISGSAPSASSRPTSRMPNCGT
jgi:crotonobetainyl-CoA:carnitine CoA-transferase CaiB-like acyl-CoA transferase